ncbi:hypothetical protein [Clostridium pasteurianum]|uniref:hypothetical protein n=1 Tax=Clostridium pasteurianum TaxID=1501 RepID=UPI0015C31401|nr:hypothetical protein [Clostridium pasteurianum]
MSNYRLKGLTHDVCKPYITYMLKAAGCSEPFFTDDAFELIYSCINGAIRPLNSLTRMCLISGDTERLTYITSDSA